jgi:3-methyl-2-oxobutanoate hydroxymethyltransferase
MVFHCMISGLRWMILHCSIPARGRQIPFDWECTEVSVSAAIRRITIPQLRARKGQEPIVALTAYTTPVARLLDPHVDVLLVGDSVGMVVHGLDSTVGVTVEMMALHTAAVRRGSTRAAIVTDLPFGSYQASPRDAFAVAHRLMVEGASAVKLEGGAEMAETVAFLTARGIPVMGHVGLLPQSVNVLGGYNARGRSPEEADRILAAAKAMAEAGAFSLVIEGTVEPLARRITAEIAIPTIGIGASVDCDGQVLVVDDLLGLTGVGAPRFVRRYADLAGAITEAATAFAADVKARRFPGPEHVFAEKKQS